MRYIAELVRARTLADWNPGIVANFRSYRRDTGLASGKNARIAYQPTLHTLFHSSFLRLANFIVSGSLYLLNHHIVIHRRADEFRDLYTRTPVLEFAFAPSAVLFVPHIHY